MRAMHALINDRFETNGRWDVGEWGLPVNQSDQAATLGLFNSTLLLGARFLGRHVSPRTPLPCCTCGSTSACCWG
ncbi:hypothetical protein [Streptomyces sp. NPDC006971]|uniref:hypothetical protein n=1 Tax=Streptomyces sp. NPDC006971 TaxID=3154784 RepID=UPI0033D4A6BE